MSRDDRRDAFVDRFKRELGYRSAKAWPIFGSLTLRRSHVLHDSRDRPRGSAQAHVPRLPRDSFTFWALRATETIYRTKRRGVYRERP